MDLLYTLQVMRESVSPLLTRFFMLVSNLTIVLVPVAMMVLYWCIDKDFGKRLAMELSYSFWFNGIAKLTACIYRPWILDSRLHVFEDAAGTATGYSFPSAHTMVASVGFNNLAVYSKKKIWKIVCVCTVILIMFSRMWLGCHSFIDVLAGLVIGIIVMLAAKFLDGKLNGNRNKSLIMLVIAIVLSIVTIMYIENKAYPMDYDAAGRLIVNPDEMKPDSYMGIGLLFGWSLGNLIEERCIKFTTDGTVWQKILRTIIGAAFFLGTFLLIKFLFRDFNGSLRSFLRMFMSCIVATVVYPWLFMKWRNRKNA